MTTTRRARAAALLVTPVAAALLTGAAAWPAAGGDRHADRGCAGDGRVLVQRSIAAVNGGDLDRLGETLAADYEQVREEVPDGLAGAQAFFGALRAVYPDLHVRIDTLLRQGDRVSALTTFSGTSADGERVSMRTADVWTVRGCRLAVHEDVIEDPDGFLAPLSAAPAAPVGAVRGR